MSDHHTPAPRPGIKAWHMALAIVAVGAILRVGLGALPETKPDPADNTAAMSPANRIEPTPVDNDLAAVEVLPFDLHGEIPGPLLTSILQRYLPNTTPNHADDLRSTLPPGEDPRMIVIIPDGDEGVMF